MFQISTRGDYGLLLLSALAEKKGQSEDFISLREIADEKGLSIKYLSQIATALKTSGFIVSREGRDGGYALAREAQKISLMEVLEALEGPVSPVRCCSTKKNCTLQTQCNVKTTWFDAKNLLVDFLKNRTVADTISSSPKADAHNKRTPR